MTYTKPTHPMLMLMNDPSQSQEAERWICPDCLRDRVDDGAGIVIRATHPTDDDHHCQDCQEEDAESAAWYQELRS